MVLCKASFCNETVLAAGNVPIAVFFRNNRCSGTRTTGRTGHYNYHNVYSHNEWQQQLTPSLKAFSPLLTLAVGLVGALIFAILDLPIPWLLGSMFSAIVAMKLTLPLASIPGLLERWMRVAIGVSLGPAVASSISLNAGDLPFAIICAVLVTLSTALGGMLWFQSQTNLPRSSSFLSAVPGGLSVFFGLSDNHGHRTQILLAHTVRVVIVVVFISLLARLLGIAPQVDVLPQGAGHSHAIVAGLSWQGGANPLVLLLLLVANFILAERVKIAGGHVIIPMLTTAAIAGLSPVPVDSPEVVQSIAMLVFGIVLGQQVAKSSGADNRQLLRAATVFSCLAILFVACIAFVLAEIIPQSFLVLFLALAPGGIAEVSLVALALGLDAGLVALLHSCRFLFIVLLGPLAFKWLAAEK